MRELCLAEYGRLRRSIDLGGMLANARRPDEQRPLLEQIIANGSSTIERAGDVADPYLMSHTYVSMAAAEFDLALADEGRRSEHVARGTRHVFDGLRLALGSGTTVVTMAILPWALVVVTGGLRAARGAESAALQRLMEGCANALPREHEKQQRDRADAARTLFEAQLLLHGARDLDRRDRKTVLARATTTARDARRLALAAGDGRVSAQAKELIAEIAKAG